MKGNVSHTLVDYVLVGHKSLTQTCHVVSNVEFYKRILRQFSTVVGQLHDFHFAIQDCEE